MALVRDLGRDLRLAARLLAKQRAFTLAAVAILGTAIGVNATVFAITDGLERRGLGPALGHDFRAGLRERVRRLNMQLEDRLDNPIGTLSGGQRQALTLVMATWLRPELLLLDEHTAALYPKSADQVIGITDDPISEAARAAQSFGMKYAGIGTDPTYTTQRAYGVRALPTVLIIDKRGVIRYKQIGVVTADVLRDKILPLVKRLDAENART